MADDDDGSTRSFGDLLRRLPLSWWLPAPGVLVHLLVLLFSHRVWTTVIETSSRSGRSGTAIDAHRYLMFLGFAVGGYVAVGLSGEGSVWRNRIGMSPPTSQEIAVVQVMLRGLCLVALYLSAFALVRSYVFK